MMPQYVVLQVTLKEKFFGTASKNLGELEAAINAQAAKGYRLHTISTALHRVPALAAATEFKRQWFLKKFKSCPAL